MKFFDYNLIDLMMMDIIDLGEKYVWDEIEEERDPIIRVQERQLYYIALSKLKKRG